jgi:hypothetical protein
MSGGWFVRLSVAGVALGMAVSGSAIGPGASLNATARGGTAYVDSHEGDQDQGEQSGDGEEWCDARQGSVIGPVCVEIDDVDIGGVAIAPIGVCPCPAA